MRPCVAIDKDDRIVKEFNAIKEASEYCGYPPDRVRKAIVHNYILGGLRWMYEEDYHNAMERKKRQILALRKLENPQRRRRKMSEETKKQIHKTTLRNREYKQFTFERVYVAFAKEHIEWMKELKDKFLSLNDFDVMPHILADYYADLRDKEIALLASLLITTGEPCIRRVMRFHKLLGDHPWEWFKNRQFSNMKEVVIGERLNIFSFFDAWWCECFKYQTCNSIKECLFKCSEKYRKQPLDMMVSICEKNRRLSRVRFALILLVCSDAEGLGQGLWGIPRDLVRIPIVGKLTSFLQTWIPDYKRYSVSDGCPALFDMDSIDFYYCYLAYERLKHMRPKECSAYATFYRRRYDSKEYTSQSTWQNNQPKIDFSPKSENFL